MMTDVNIKRQVREFYDRVGWQCVGDCCYQNARFEDLRPVAQEYIHKCHMRVMRHLAPEGEYFLDAGSGPIQYPEYLEYSKGYRYRVCADLSMLALQEARRRLGERGFYVVADVANLPFKPGSFGAIVSLHTIHHLPQDEHLQAYEEIQRVLAEDSHAVVVNGWRASLLMNLLKPLMKATSAGIRLYRRLRGGKKRASKEQFFFRNKAGGTAAPQKTYVVRQSYDWLMREVAARMPVEIYPWRSVSTPFLKTLVHPRLGGCWLLRVVYRLEEWFPKFMGRYGQYPLIVFRKADGK
jgi:SAM-dependent methyltransferase